MPHAFGKFNERYTERRDWFGWIALTLILVLGGYVGWICIVAGTPGQWAPFGMIN